MHYVVAKPSEAIPPIHKYHPNNKQMPPKYTNTIQIRFSYITQIGQKLSKMDKNGGWLKWTGGKLILCGWAQFDSSNTTFIGSTIDRGPAQQRDFG